MMIAFTTHIGKKHALLTLFYVPMKYTPSLDPRRSAAIPDAILDVIVNDPVVDQRILSLQVQQQEATPLRLPSP